MKRTETPSTQRDLDQDGLCPENYSKEAKRARKEERRLQRDKREQNQAYIEMLMNEASRQDGGVELEVIQQLEEHAWKREDEKRAQHEAYKKEARAFWKEFEKNCDTEEDWSDTNFIAEISFGDKAQSPEFQREADKHRPHPS